MRKAAKQKRMARIVKSMQEYVATYTQQAMYPEYSDTTFIDDMLYGIGIAIDPDEYRAARGYTKFRETLRKHIGTVM